LTGRARKLVLTGWSGIRISGFRRISVCSSLKLDLEEVACQTFESKDNNGSSWTRNAISQNIKTEPINILTIDKKQRVSCRNFVTGRVRNSSIRWTPGNNSVDKDMHPTRLRINPFSKFNPHLHNTT
jgi:hypothetical protein